jgi:hypothetical protein
VPKVPQARIVDAGDKSFRAVGRTIIGYDDFQVCIGLIQGALQRLRQIEIRPVIGWNRNRN